jgi:cytochrome c5
VSKRIWIVILVGLTLLLSACGGGDLAEDLTPVPTLAAGQAPTLISALPAEGSEGEATEEAASGEEAAATEEAASGEEGAATAGGDAAVGEQIFSQTCSGCHGETDTAGPARPGMGERAATRVEGMSAEEYIHQSIVDPSAFVVEGFGDIMPKDYEAQFSEEEIASLVAYLMTQ